jgi:hypothetical protein
LRIRQGERILIYPAPEEYAINHLFNVNFADEQIRRMKNYAETNTINMEILKTTNPAYGQVILVRKI